MKSTLVLGLALMLTAVLATSCETLSPAGEVSEDFGGFTPGNEAPGFGDADLLSDYPDETPYGDDLADDPSVRDAERHPRAQHYALRIVWGNLDHPDTTVNPGEDCPVTDWSGSVALSGGVIIVKQLIRFDPGDYIVRPRRGPSEVRWVSHTKDHLDGIVFKVVDTPDPHGYEAANTLTITTPFYSAVIPLADLEDHREFVVYDDCNKISVVAAGIDPTGCPRGFIEGRWMAETDTSGFFKGIWIGHEGGIAGHVRGRYAIRDGERVLFGKWITRSGDFGGLLKGTWAPVDVAEGPDGYFEGMWVDETRTVKGFFRGHYCFSDAGTEGFFHGRWARVCR